MAVRVRVRLKRIPGKKKRGIELVMSAGFKVVDQLTDEVSYQQLKVLLSERILPANWDAETQRPNPKFSKKDKHKLNSLIDRHVDFLLKAYRRVDESELIEQVTVEEVKKEYLKLTGRTRRVKVQARITHFIDSYVEKTRLEKSTTIYQYSLLSDRIRQFEVESKQALYWQTYSFGVHEDFILWLEERFRLGSNTLWNFEKLLVKFRAQARQEGMLKDQRDWRRVTRYVQPDKMYLTWEMIRQIMDFEPTTPQLRNVKSLFLIYCFTGIRIGDTENFLNSYVDDLPFSWAHLKLSKHPNPECLIPCLEPVRRIMSHSKPNVVSPSQLHSQLRHLMTLVFDASTARAISAHIGRYSFLSLFSHLPPACLRKIVGHATPSESRVHDGYNKLSLKENAILFMRLVRTIPIEETAGIRLVRFSEEVNLN